MGEIIYHNLTCAHIFLEMGLVLQPPTDTFSGLSGVQIVREMIPKIGRFRGKTMKNLGP